MKMARIILACLAGLASITAASGQEKSAVGFAGTEAFSHLLHGSNLKPIAKVEDAWTAPEKTLLIIFGDLSKLENLFGSKNIAQKMEKFMKHGGAASGQ